MALLSSVYATLLRHFQGYTRICLFVHVSAYVCVCVCVSIYLSRYKIFLAILCPKLVTSNFFFYQSVLQRPVLQTCKNQGLFRKGLNDKKVSISLLEAQRDNIFQTSGYFCRLRMEKIFMVDQRFPRIYLDSIH